MPSGVPCETRNAKDRDVVLRVEGNHLGLEAVVVPSVDLRLVDAGDDVRVRGDQLLPHDPSRSFDAEPAGEAGDADDRRPRRANCGDLQNRGIGRIDSGGRADDRGERVDAHDRVHDRRRRQRLRERRDHARLLGQPAAFGLAGKVEERRADDPADRETRAQPERAPTRRVEPAQRRQDRDQPPCGAADERARDLPEHAADRRTAERDERDVRARVTDDLGREARADERTGNRAPRATTLPSAARAGSR